MSRQKSIPDAIALRYSEKFAPPEGTIATHLNILKTHGFVWYGKIGKTISNKVIADLLNKGETRLLLIDSGKTDRYWADVVSIVKEKPDGYYPDYYSRFVDDIKTWFKITGISKASNDVLSHCTVTSSGALLTTASKHSMSPFFIINVEDNYL